MKSHYSVQFRSILASNLIFAQGPPINTNTAFVMGLEGGAIRSYLKIVSKSTLLKNGNKITDEMDRKVNVFAFPIMVPYEVIPNKLVVIGAIPYIKKEMNLTQNGKRITRRNAGLGDFKLLAKYQFFQRDSRNSTLRMTGLGGIEFPTGKDNKSDSIGLLPAPLQLGSGSIDFIGGTIVTYVKNRIGFNTEVIYKKNTKAIDYQFGDVLTLNIALGYRIFPKVYNIYPSPYSTVYIELLSQFSGKDKMKNTMQKNTGGNILMVSPGLQHVFSRTFLLEASLQYPVSQKLNGIQLGDDYTFNFGFRWLIN